MTTLTVPSAVQLYNDMHKSNVEHNLKQPITWMNTQ